MDSVCFSSFGVQPSDLPISLAYVLPSTVLYWRMLLDSEAVLLARSPSPESPS